ncbi:MAG: hypothetical protein NTY50_17540 [Methylobacter sp.]|nr:hypothetical protein [Methylobacter sp.]
MSKRKHPKRYPTDLNTRKWNVIRDLLPTALSGGRPRKVNLRKILNATLTISPGVVALGICCRRTTFRRTKQIGHPVSAQAPLFC